MAIKNLKLVVPLVLAGIAGIGLTAAALAHTGSSGGEGRSVCGGPGMGSGGGHGGDMMGIHYLFAHRDQIRRVVAQIPGGVRTTTESDDATVAGQLREHVRAMYARLKDHRPINTHDPLFAALFENADKVEVRIEDTPKGLSVTETSKEAEVVPLIRRHAEVVGLFLANGMHEMMQRH